MKKIYMTLVMLFAIAASMAQPREIKGVVHDENDKPMSGVTVYVQETGAGTITGSKGTYSIKIPGPKSEITFSFMGYKTLKLKADDPKAKFDVIKLVPDQQMLDAVEVVQVGYGTQKKVNLLGSAENVSVKDLENRPITQASMALQGTISGIDVVQNSGQPGQDQGSIRIRGVSSIANNNEPLVLIDGVEGDINQVNPKDIESMSVLKDASSAAIYGNRAAAGVVLITTKSGEGSGELKVSYNGSFSLQETTALPKPVKVLEWLDLKEEMFLYNGEIKNYDSDREKYISGEKVSVNYYLRHFRIAPMHDHYLSMSMGGKNYNGSVSLGYGNQDGVLKGTDNEKISFRSNVSMYSTNRKFFTTLNLSGYRKDMTSTAMGTNQTIQDIHRAGPTSIFKAYNGLYGFYGRHMGQLEAGGRTKNVSNQLTAKISAGVEPVKGLKIQGSFATVYFNSRNDQFVAPIYTVGDLYGDVQNKVASFIEIKNSTTLSTTTELTASYKKRFDRHDLSVLAGASQYWWRNEWEMARRDNMSSFTPSLNMGDPATQVNDNAINERATRSLFGRVNYSYDDRYLFEVNVRYDGSSRFLQQEMGPFPVGGRRMAYLPGELLQELRRDRVYQQPQAACIVGTPRQRVYLLELHRVPDPLDRQLLRFQRYAGSRCGHHRAFEQGYLVGDFRTDQHRSRHRHLEPLLTDSRHLLQEDHRYSDETAHSAVADRQRKRRPLSECRQHGEQRSRTDAQLPPDLSQQDVRRRHVHDHFPA